MIRREASKYVGAKNIHVLCWMAALVDQLNLVADIKRQQPGRRVRTCSSQRGDHYVHVSKCIISDLAMWKDSAGGL